MSHSSFRLFFPISCQWNKFRKMILERTRYSLNRVWFITLLKINKFDSFRFLSAFFNFYPSTCEYCQVLELREIKGVNNNNKKIYVIRGYRILSSTNVHFFFLIYFTSLGARLFIFGTICSPMCTWSKIKIQSVLS